MADLKQRLEEVMSVTGWGYPELVAAAGESRSVVSQWLGRGSKEIKSIGKMEAAERIERASGFAALWVAKGVGPKRAEVPRIEQTRATPAIERQEISQAHSMSHPEPIVLPTTIDWEDIMTRDLPPTFSLIVKDEAMAPALGVGHKAIFATGREPAPGAIVLLVDRDGHTYIRTYQLRRPGHWQAVAHNAAYQPLDSIADGLRVLAVQIGALWG